MTDISRQYLQDAYDAGCDANWDAVFALRAALDAAEARERQAVEAEREAVISLLPIFCDRFTVDDIAAAIRTGAKP